MYEPPTGNARPLPPYINAHTHIFTTKHVPPFLGKKVVPAPFAFLVAAYLHPEELDLIARYNPAKFLSSQFYP